MTRKGKKKRNVEKPTEGGDAAGSSQQSTPQEQTTQEAHTSQHSGTPQPQQQPQQKKDQTHVQPQKQQQQPQPQQQQKGQAQAQKQPRGPRERGQDQAPPQQQPGGPHGRRQGQAPPQQQPGGPHGRGQGQAPPQQRPGGPPAWVPGQVPPQQQPGGPPAWGPGQVPPQQQLGGPLAWGPRQVPPQLRPGGPPAWIPGQVPPQQQPGGPPAWGPGQVPPQQQLGGPPAWGPGQVPPQQQPGGPHGGGQGQAPPQQWPGGPPAWGPGQVPPQQQPGGPPAWRPAQVPPQQQLGGRPAWGPGQVPPHQQEVGLPMQKPGQMPVQQQQTSGPPSRASSVSSDKTGTPVQQQTSGPPSRAPSVSSVKTGKSPSTAVKQYSKLPAMKSDVIKSTIPSDLALQYMLQIPRRADPVKGGTLGIPIKVETNMLKIILSNNFKTNATHYDVSFDPDKPKFLMRPAYEKFRVTHFPQRFPAFDGKKNLFSAGDLPFGHSITDTIKVYNTEREKEVEYRITLTKVQTVDLSWLKQIKPGSTDLERNKISVQVLDIILRHGTSSQCVTVGRSLFKPPSGRVVSLSNGLDLWVGVFQSAVVGWKPYLNIDVAHKGFPTPQNVVDLIREMCQGRDDRGQGNIDLRMLDRNKEKLSKFLKGLKVQYAIPGHPGSKKVQRVNDLALCPRRNVFNHNGTEISVEKYFSREKNYNLVYPELPCLWVGSRDRKVYVPAELCTIVAGQAVQKKTDEEQTKRMVKTAATGTIERKEKILNGFASMNVNNSPTVKNEFNLSVGGQFETIPARVLPPPLLMYDTQVRVNKGVWRAGKFIQPSNLADGSWTILNLNGQYTKDGDLYYLQEELIKTGATVGMSIGKAETPFTTLSVLGRDVRQIESYFADKKKRGLRLVVVVIPDRLDIAYCKVKQVSELRTGVLTQCIKGLTLKKFNPATAGNILLKLNAKLNGINHNFVPKIRPKCFDQPTILVGADVTHPSPDAVDIPSIAAVAASHDPKAFQYNIEIRLQPPRTEIIQELEEIMRLQLMFFYKKTGYKPLKVIFYRDGVSDGQLPHVLHFEVNAIKKAFKRLAPDGSYNPPITFLVVQKRHHIRLFPTDKRFSDDRNFNVQAGTIVDTDITHPTDIDFYLVSHASIQGTARPTKYRCILNDIKLTEDEIEELTYYLCHMFARCTRSVSYPAPTYYAHLAAFRARALIHDVPIELSNLQRAQLQNLTLQVHTQAPMFFV